MSLRRESKTGVCIGDDLTRPTRSRRAFTLLEVMIASGILFMCLFAILALVANSLRNARTLQRQTVEVGSVASWLYTQLSPTNKIPEGVQDLDLSDLDESYRDYHCSWEAYQIATNNLYQVDILLRRRMGNDEGTKMSFIFYPANAQPSTFGGRLR
jgi:hypothetical protein